MKNITSIFIIGFFSINTFSQVFCESSVVPPTVLNGINITEQYTGSVSTFPFYYITACSNTTTPANSKYLGEVGSFTYTMNFDKPVNGLIINITATGSPGIETFTITTNSGNPVISIL